MIEWLTTATNTPLDAMAISAMCMMFRDGYWKSALGLGFGVSILQSILKAYV